MKINTRKIFVLLCLTGLFASQYFDVAAQLNKTAGIRRINSYCKSVDKLFRRTKTPDLVFADVSHDEKANWRKFASEKALETFRDNTEIYSISLNWLNDQTIVRSIFMLSSGSGDWARFDHHCFRADGSLAKAESEIRTFHGNMSATKTFYFDGKGNLLKKTLRYADFDDRKLTRPNEEFLDAHSDFLDQVDYFKKTSKLPFAHLVTKR